MNKRLGKWQIVIGYLIILMGILAMIVQPFIATLVILYGIYVVFVGMKIKKGNHRLQK